MGSTEKQLDDHQPSIKRSEDDDACLYAMHLSSSHVFAMVLKAAVELNLFEIIARVAASPATADAYLSTSEIASQLPTKNPDAPSLLDRMLRLLASYSLLTCSVRTGKDGSDERLYGLAPAGKFYVQNEDGYSLASMPLFSHHPAAAEVRLHLKDAILEEGNTFEKVHGRSAYQHMNADPTFNKVFNKAMADISGITMTRMLETYKGFEGLSSLVDVAGGTGATLNMIISKYPSIKGINFDLPHVIQHAPSYPGIENVAGDMFASVPKGDAIMMKATCHNWSDGHCIKILNNCNKALQQNGKVIIIDYIMPEAPESSDAAKYVSSLDNVMLVNLGGKERTEKEFEALSKSSGFSGFRLVCRAYNVFGVMELYK
ncbi:caffeic acid 3-O-methyltransferase-like [Corylus avellana]|uniref:caffeic acid 3-O-methyltransferase-like n=1 Tax=Corylus avellana TaxID=13451 RepID=UPI001E20981F|nr:caffeic acid 3-O-methyltransferase-like [Corylus avellana]